jgi:maleylpyruvate isomerase
MKLVLHNYWRSSASHRVRIALGLKGIAYEYVSVNLIKAEQHADGYRTKNPHAQLPTLEVIEGGSSRFLTQSLPILEYLEERWPEVPILPKDPYLRARSRALAEVVNSGIQPFQNLSTFKAIKAIGGEDVAWVKPWIGNGLESYAKLAADTARDFSVGEEPTIADCCLIPQLASARRFCVDYSHLELLVRIEKACMALPAFVAAAPENQPDAVKA